MPTTSLPDGAEIWFRSEGSGPTLVQLHGSAFGHRNFERLTPCLTGAFTVVDPDLPGYGESHGGPDLTTFEERADQVHAFLQRLDRGPVHVHGTSFGAMIALALAARHPDDVDRLVLSCFLARYDHSARMMRATWKRAARDSGMAAVTDLTAVAGFARSFFDRPEAQEQLASMRTAFSATDPEAFVAATESIEATDLSALVTRVGAPTLLLAGAEDNMTPFDAAPSGVSMSAISQQIPGAQTHVIPRSGHYLVIEAPEEAARLMTDFLRPAR